MAYNFLIADPADTFRLGISLYSRHSDLVAANFYLLRLVSIPQDSSGLLTKLRDQSRPILAMDKMIKRSIKLELISTPHCLAHWTVTLHGFGGSPINKDISGKTLPSLYFERVFETIEFPVNDHCPPLDGLEEYTSPADQTEQQMSCRCVPWV